MDGAAWCALGPCTAARVVWRRPPRLSLIVLCAVFMWLLGRAAAGDLLDVMAKDSLVVLADAPAKEVGDAAGVIAARLRSASGASVDVVRPGAVVGDLELAAYHHLVLVGTRSDNAVLRQFWGHFAADKDAPWRADQEGPRDTFFAYGFGHFKGDDVGWVECDENPYSRVAASLGLPSTGYRIIVRVTGSGPVGVMRAADALVREHLISGVVPGQAGMVSDSLTFWRLSPEAASPPPITWVPLQSIAAGAGRVDYVGRHAATGGLYSAFRDMLGQAVSAAYRHKYVTDKGMTDFESGPHHRACGNELVVGKMTQPAAVAAALDRMGDKLGGKGNCQLMQVSGIPVRVAPGHHMFLAWNGYVMAESLAAPYDDALIAELCKRLSAMTSLEIAQAGR